MYFRYLLYNNITKKQINLNTTFMCLIQCIFFRFCNAQRTFENLRKINTLLYYYIIMLQ